MVPLSTSPDVQDIPLFPSPEPTELIAPIFFDIYDTVEKMSENSNLRDLLRYVATEEVDVKGWSGSYLGVLLSSGYTAYGRKRLVEFLRKSPLDKVRLYDEMRARQCSGFQARLLDIGEFVYLYKIPLNDAQFHYDNAFSWFGTYRGAHSRRIPYEGWRFPIEHVRHCLISGQTRMGKSVDLIKVMTMELNNGASCIDLQDSGGRLESVAAAFAIDDDKYLNLIRMRWRDIGIDSFETAKRIVSDILRVRGRVKQFYDGGNSFKVVYHHPIVETLPDSIPITENLRFEFFAFGVSSLVRSLGDTVFSEIFATLGDKLNPTDETYLTYAFNHLKALGNIEISSLKDISDLLTVWNDSKDGVQVEFGDVTRNVNFSGKNVMNLIRKVDSLHLTGLFQPDFVMENGELIRNPLVLDVVKMCSEKGVLNCFTTKWANPDLRYIIISYVVREVMEGKRLSKIGERVSLFSRELNEIAPYMPKGLERLTRDAVVDVVSRGADLGVRFVADCQQLSQLDRKVKRMIHVYLIHRIIDSREKDDIVKSLSRYSLPVEFKDGVSLLDIGECYAVYGGAFAKVKVIPANCMNKVEGLDMIRLLGIYSDEVAIPPKDISPMTGSSILVGKHDSKILEIPESVRRFGIRSKNIVVASVIYSGLSAIRMKRLIGEAETFTFDELRERHIQLFGGLYKEEITSTRGIWSKVFSYDSDSKLYSVNRSVFAELFDVDLHIAVNLMLDDLSSYFGIG